jgi:predicted nucleic acid-binding protein
MISNALLHNLTLVTYSIRKFIRVEGLQLEDWEVEA